MAIGLVTKNSNHERWRPFRLSVGYLCPEADASGLPPRLRRGGNAAHAHEEGQGRKWKRVRDLEVSTRLVSFHSKNCMR